MAKAKIRFVVECKKHGVESKDWAGKQVVVAASKHRSHMLNTGCPMCKAEARNVSKEN